MSGIFLTHNTCSFGISHAVGGAAVPQMPLLRH